LWVDEDFEMVAVEVKRMDLKYTGELLGIYKAPREDMRVVARLAAPTGFSQNSAKSSFKGGDLNSFQAGWNENAEGISGNQASISRWANYYTQVVGRPGSG
jgi:hypothetical protein